MNHDDNRVAVTGGGGFVGHALVEDQLRRGQYVSSIDLRHPRPLPAGLATRAKRVDASILERAPLERVMAGCTVVFHLASAHLEVRPGEDHFRTVNVEGTRRVIEAAAASGAHRVIHVSSVGVYGQIANQVYDEESPPAPTIPYERTKLEGESAARETAAARGIELVIVRPSWIYGAGCRRTRKIFNAIRKHRFLMVGDGRTRRDGLYISDCVRGLDLCSRHPAAAGETYLLASGEAPTLHEWVGAIAEAQHARPPRFHVPVAPMWLLGWGLETACKMIGKDAPFSRRSIKFFTNATVFRPDKIRQRLGFQPEVTWRDGVRKTAEAMRAHTRTAEL